MLLALLALCVGTVSVASHDTQSPPCACSSGFFPVPGVDVIIPVDPSNPEGLNSTNTFRLRTTFDVYGGLCQTVSEKSKTSHAIQLLMHRQTYNTQYWDVTWGGFQNYSYMAYSCRRGISSFAHDNIGSGRTVRPANSSQCQLPVAAQVASSISRDLQSGRISRIFTGVEKRYSKVVGIGHSMGSGTLNYAAISEGSHAPFDGLILTGSVHGTLPLPAGTLQPASAVNPVRWGDLDPGYISTADITGRAVLYGPAGSFSPTMLQLEELTKDAGSLWMATQIVSINQPARGFTGSVVELVGAMDKLLCVAPCNQATLQVSETAFFPDSKNFTMIIVDGDPLLASVEPSPMPDVAFEYILCIAPSSYCPPFIALPCATQDAHKSGTKTKVYFNVELHNRMTTGCKL